MASPTFFLGYTAADNQATMFSADKIVALAPGEDLETVDIILVGNAHITVQGDIFEMRDLLRESSVPVIALSEELELEDEVEGDDEAGEENATDEDAPALSIHTP